MKRKMEGPAPVEGTFHLTFYKILTFSSFSGGAWKVSGGSHRAGQALSGKKPHLPYFSSEWEAVMDLGSRASSNFSRVM